MKDISQRTDGHPYIHFILVVLKCGSFIEFGSVHSGHTYFSLVWLCLYLFGDAAIFVQVVQVEGPVEPIIYSPSQDDGEAKHKVLVQKQHRRLDFDRIICGNICDTKSSVHERTSKLTEPFLFVSKASKRKCAYILESAKTLSDPWCT